MKGNNKIWIAVVAVVVLLLVVFLLTWSSKPHYSWLETYKNDSKGPFGVLVTYKLLDKYFDDYRLIDMDTPYAKVFEDPKLSYPANYVVIGNSMFMDSASTSALMEFVACGNKAFLSVKNLPWRMSDQLLIDTTNCDEWDGYFSTSDTEANFKLLHPDLDSNKVYKHYFVFKGDTLYYDWLYYYTDDWCNYDLDYAVLGTMNDSMVNFIRVPYGQGYFYLHTAPLAFSNYFMLEKSHLEYAEKAFSHLTPGDIIWDERVKDPLLPHQNKHNPQVPVSPLRFILGEPSLRWAWYLTIAAVIIYTLFHIKRRQKAIPVIEPPANTSLEFVQTIGDLYFQQNDHNRLASLKMKHFLADIRTRYRMNTSTDDTEKLIKDIARRAEVEEKTVSKIFFKYKFIQDTPNILETHLIEFNTLINNFYKSAK